MSIAPEAHREGHRASDASPSRRKRSPSGRRLAPHTKLKMRTFQPSLRGALATKQSSLSLLWRRWIASLNRARIRAPDWLAMTRKTSVAPPRSGSTVYLVCAARIERATPPSRTECSAWLSYAQMNWPSPITHESYKMTPSSFSTDVLIGTLAPAVRFERTFLR